MIKGKALRRALQTEDAIRLDGKIPLIVDKTELITPEIAQEMLHKNNNNRPINWKKVEEYADLMRKGEWKFHSQGIILDSYGNILTGQKRLWAIIYSGVTIPMRISRGCPSDIVRTIDRGTPQSSKDLAARETKRKHSTTEASLARAMLILSGTKPNTDLIADMLIKKERHLALLMKETKGTKKTRAILMILAVLCFLIENDFKLKSLSKNIEGWAKILDEKLFPSNANKCWGRGVAFILALEQAKKIVESAIK